MNAQTISFELPVEIVHSLEGLARESALPPAEVVARLIIAAAQQHAIVSQWRDLREQVRQEGHPMLGASRDDIMALARKTRDEIFEAEYAH